MRVCVCVWRLIAGGVISLALGSAFANTLEVRG